MKTPIDEPITMFKKQFNFLSMAVHPLSNFRFVICNTIKKYPASEGL